LDWGVLKIALMANGSQVNFNSFSGPRSGPVHRPPPDVLAAKFAIHILCAQDCL
jgi:hypothetical protein